MTRSRSLACLLVCLVVAVLPVAAVEGQVVNTGPGGGGAIISIGVDPADANRVFVGADAGGPWRSTDGGQAWTMLGDRGAPASAPGDPGLPFLRGAH